MAYPPPIPSLRSTSQCTPSQHILLTEGGFVQLGLPSFLSSNLVSTDISACCHLERAGPLGSTTIGSQGVEISSCRQNVSVYAVTPTARGPQMLDALPHPANLRENHLSAPRRGPSPALVPGSLSAQQLKNSVPAAPPGTSSPGPQATTTDSGPLNTNSPGTGAARPVAPRDRIQWIRRPRSAIFPA